MRTRFMFFVMSAVFATAVAAQAGQQRIALCFNNLNDVFHIRIVEAAKQYVAENPELSLEIADAQHDIMKQQDQIRDFINNGVDILVVSIVDSSSVAPITALAGEAGLPLLYILFDPYPGKDVPPGRVHYLGSPTTEGGEMQMEYVGGLMGGKGNIGIMMGMLTNEATYSRTQGVKNVIERQYPGIRIIGEECGNWQRDQGLQIAENWVVAFGSELNAIIANNDEMALGAALALKNQGIKNVYVAGIDATPDALRALEAGEMAVTVFQNAEAIGYEGMRSAHDMLQGKTLEKRIWIPLEKVTPDNLPAYKKMYQEKGLW